MMDWDDENQLLYASGNVDYIRLWDVNSEMKLRVSESRRCFF